MDPAFIIFFIFIIIILTRKKGDELFLEKMKIGILTLILYCLYVR